PCSPGSEGLTSPPTVSAWKWRGSPKSTRTHPESSLTTGPMFPTSEISMTPPNHQQSMCSREDSPARTTAWQDAVQDWLVTVARSGGKCIGSLLNAAPPGLLEKTFMDLPLGDIRTPSERSSEASWTSGMAWSGGYLTLNGSEWPSDAAVSSLSDILEDNPDPKYSLSPRACRGILRRAEKRGDELPPALRRALEAVANSKPTPS